MRNTTLFFVLIFLISGCFSYSKNINKNGNQLPPDIGKEKTILWVVTHDNKKYDNYLKNCFSKYYNGEMVFIPFGTYPQKYRDNKVYRYQFDYITTGISIDRNVTTEHRDFRIIDNLEQKTYQTDFQGFKWKDLMKAYVQKLEKLRIQNGGH
jgi:hypothetical protein